jgi:hypothetical protein
MPRHFLYILFKKRTCTAAITWHVDPKLGTYQSTRIRDVKALYHGLLVIAVATYKRTSKEVTFILYMQVVLIGCNYSRRRRSGRSHLFEPITVPCPVYVI